MVPFHLPEGLLDKQPPTTVDWAPGWSSLNRPAHCTVGHITCYDPCSEFFVRARMLCRGGVFLAFLRLAIASPSHPGAGARVQPCMCASIFEASWGLMFMQACPVQAFPVQACPVQACHKHPPCWHPRQGNVKQVVLPQHVIDKLIHMTEHIGTLDALQPDLYIRHTRSKERVSLARQIILVEMSCLENLIGLIRLHDSALPQLDISDF